LKSVTTTACNMWLARSSSAWVSICRNSSVADQSTDHHLLVSVQNRYLLCFRHRIRPTIEPRPTVPSMNGRASGITSQAIRTSPSETIAPARVPGTDILPKLLGEVGRCLSVVRGIESHLLYPMIPIDGRAVQRRSFPDTNSAPFMLGLCHKICRMRASLPVLLATVFFACSLGWPGSNAPRLAQATRSGGSPSRTYLGFDRNKYPGDTALKSLRQVFSFSGYWLNAPPNEASNTWQGKREVLTANGFGFLVLFNGRLFRELKSVEDAKTLGAGDAAVAAETAKKEKFPPGTVIFLDQEEGGRMLPEQRAYVYEWTDAVNASAYRAGVYCSGIPAIEARAATIITANDLRDNADERKIVFLVYNDSCPPSPGCAFPKNPPPPQQSGVPFAAIWQFAQSPRRRKITAACASTYHSDGNCYALSQSIDGIDVDLDSANSPDPSSGRR